VVKPARASHAIEAKTSETALLQKRNRIGTRRWSAPTLIEIETWRNTEQLDLHALLTGIL